MNDISSLQSSPKSNPRKSSKFASLKVISIPMKISILKFFKFCVCCLKLIKKPPTTMETLKPKEYTLPILSFFKLFILIIRIKDAFRNRTRFRSLKGLKELQIYLIDDLASFRKKLATTQTKLNYVTCGFLRRILRKLRQFRKAVRKFKGSRFIKK